MRRVVAALTAVLTTVGFVMLVVPAQADTKCQQTDPTTGQCLIWVEVPGTPGTPGDDETSDPEDTGPGHACYWDPAKQGISKPPAGPVPCQSPAGYWSNTYNCYIKIADPQPPAGDDAWQEHEPGDGAVYQCHQPQTDMTILIWSRTTPEASGSGPSPREVALLAVDSLSLKAIDIGITPEPGTDRVGIVGMPVWMWAKDPDSRTFGPATASASAGGVTVTATAKVRQITWDMGDGSDPVVCRTAGTPYQSRFGQQSSPDCGYRYDSDGTYTVTATSDWIVSWAGAGQTGTIRLDGLTRSVQIRVGEAQVLVQ